MGSDIESARDTPVRQLIAELAYQMWENEGRPHGCDVIHWLQAEQDIMSCIEPSRTYGQVARAGSADPLDKASVTVSAHS